MVTVGLLGVVGAEGGREHREQSLGGSAGDA